MATVLDIGSFTEFYTFLWDGWEPFDWQRELVEQVYGGQWPELIDLPTGTGKTATIDTALFLLALNAGRPHAERRAPRRIVMVVDRRVVVDQAADRAKAILTKLELAEPSSIGGRVASALRSLSDAGPGDPPFVVGEMRGGIVRDESWARRPDVPAVMASTVDQVGSRLLFRGYGVSPRMSPVHAGLLGTDTLFLLDEVHLSRPFADTLRAVERYRDAAEKPLPSRWSVVELSATPGRSGRTTFPASRLDPDSSPVLSRRLRASKPAILRLSKGSDRLAADCAAAAVELLGGDSVRALAVVVNRVRTARQVAAALGGVEAEVVTLTGRMRPLDRDRIVGQLQERIRTGRNRTADDPRLVVVATQCIEAGADFDFDGLVTQCASIAALRQRFGRVDRDGQLSRGGTPAPGVIVASAADIAATDDPVYGSALAATWRALEQLPSVDFRITYLDELGLDKREDLTAPHADAPYLLPAHLDSWVQTSPVPRPDPDPALWLHGLDQPGVPDVQVVWRADLTAGFLLSEQEAVVDLVRACPPGSAEAMSLPINAVRAWLADAPATEQPAVADVEGGVVEEPPASRRTRRGPSRPALRWNDPRVIAAPGELKPGDLLVVPATYGGVMPDGNWDPEATTPVSDLGTEVQLTQRGRVVLRLFPPLWADRPRLPIPEAVPDDDSDRETVLGWLGAQADKPEALHCLQHEGRTIVRRMTGPRHKWEDQAGWVPTTGTADYFVVTCKAPFLDREAYDPDGDRSTFTAAAVTLAEHLSGVGRFARKMTTNLGLPVDHADDIELAARLHDLGKADPRFQVILHGGDEIAAAIAESPLAKSRLSDTDSRRERAIRRQSGYPKHARHELMSLALIEGTAAEKAAHDVDLVRYLVSSHHGLCRPFAPAVPDQEPVAVEVAVGDAVLRRGSDHTLARLDSDVADRFWRLVRRYGWHGLAWLEAILQLADHRCSAEEQRKHPVVDREGVRR